ncbi:dimethylarginine dimethylaminohydrolase family protein [Amphibacillus sp. Q70]|uniref:dimethylarginine dimethylaminohydrolase family protein n=1 Tax=Amphibacillus sp. Q70 TaxID=3453416 RepID=UPI003F870E33
MRLANKNICHNEYDQLKQVVVTPPAYMQIDQVINETQKYYQNANIDIDKALEQHHFFTRVMQKHGVNVLEIDPEPTLNEQVFTRDIGVTIGNQVIVAQMATELREREIVFLKKFLTERDISYQEILIDSLEGGDVLIDGQMIWVGISKRTTEKAVQVLRKLLPDYQIETIHLTDDILHLDCTFNILSSNHALIYPTGMAEQDYQKIKSHYQCIHVDQAEQFTLGTNVLSIEEGKIISLPENKQTNTKLKEAGFEVIEVPFNEIIKSGGSFRCCTMPIYRAK